MHTTILKLIFVAMTVGMLSYADPTATIPFSIGTGTDCDSVIKACDNALKAKDAHAEALKKAVEQARKEADDCYSKRKETSSGGGWLAPLAIGIAGGLLLGIAVGR